MLRRRLDRGDLLARWEAAAKAFSRGTNDVARCFAGATIAARMSTANVENGRKKRWLTKKRVLWFCFIAHFFVVNEILIFMVRRYLPLANTIKFVDTSVQEARDTLAIPKREWTESAMAVIGPVTPFEEIEAFDDDAKSWGQFFTQMGAEGVLVFDANGDGRLDVYFAQDGQNWTRPTDAKGVLKDKPRLMGNVLYLNQGNDENGRPRFVQVGELPGAKGENAEAEMLIEGFLFARKSTTDSKQRFGRCSEVAVAADFNADGRIDLLVGNGLPGMFWSHEKTRRVLPAMAEPVGRDMRQSKQPMRPFGQYLVDYKPRSNLKDRRKSARGDEAFGANSLYLNMGDTDGDGIPEWKDVSREAGIEGFRHTSGLTVADFDLDGDLDVFACNLPDLDYWPAGSTSYSGAANCIYINQLKETGKLTFVERGAEMGIDGVYDEDYPREPYWRLRRVPFLAVEYSFMFRKLEPYHPDYLTIDGVEAEHGQMSHACVVQDVDDDGYPDIWVANDFGYLRLYKNVGGKKFENTPHARSKRTGYWMSFAPGDFNGDLKEDLMAGNLGGAVMNNATVPYVPNDLFKPTMLAGTIVGQFLGNRHDSSHGLIDGADWRRELPNEVQHSSILPPDVALPNNYRREAYGRDIPKDEFDVDSLDPYEFAWGSVCFDVQNDGEPDLYWHGGLYGRGGGLFSVLGTCPGRLLINATEASGKKDGKLRFVDLTAEHHVFNIQEMRYDKLATDGYLYRRAPRQNWGKRDSVNSYDRSVWASEGPMVNERVINQDMIQTAENGRAAIAADLNGDGAVDLLLRNKGGYDSRGSDSVNLKFMHEGRARVLPAHDNNYPTPTNFEPGSTRVFLNRYHTNNWLEVTLVDDRPDALNRDAIGARVILDKRWLKVRRSGEGSFASSRFVPLHFGLGKATANELEIHWPDRERTVTKVSLGGIKNARVRISRTKGLIR